MSRHSTANIHPRETPTVDSPRISAGGGPTICVDVKAGVQVCTWAYLGSRVPELEINVETPVHAYLSPEHARALRDGLTAALAELGEAEAPRIARAS